MGKNNKKRNNVQNTNRGGYSNSFKKNNNNEKPAKQFKPNPNRIKAHLYLPDDVDDKLYGSIMDVIGSMRFNKISIILGTYRRFLNDDVAEDDTRITTIGYINRYDRENEEFTLTIFNNFLDIVKSFEHVMVELLYTTTRDGDLGTITKFNLIPIEYVDEDDYDEDVIAAADDTNADVCEECVVPSADDSDELNDDAVDELTD